MVFWALTIRSETRGFESHLLAPPSGGVFVCDARFSEDKAYVPYGMIDSSEGGEHDPGRA